MGNTIQYGHILNVKNLKVAINNINIIDDISFIVPEKKTFGIVGESGAGKSLTALAILKLLPDAAKIISGNIYFKQEDILPYTESKMQNIRGSEISLVTQEPMSAFNPVKNIYTQMIEPLIIHKKYSTKELKDIVIQKLEEVKIPNPKQVLKQYPHQLSGGMLQRISIAMALIGSPSMLIADEPTTALDVTLQSQIMELLNSYKQSGLSIVFVSHNLAVINEISDYVAVMYAGKIVEYASRESLFSFHMHPYTDGLFKCIPDLNNPVSRLFNISGNMSSSYNIEYGCKFQPRCDKSAKICIEKAPKLSKKAPGHFVSCWMVK